MFGPAGHGPSSLRRRRCYPSLSFSAYHPSGEGSELSKLLGFVCAYRLLLGIPLYAARSVMAANGVGLLQVQ